MSTKHTPGPWHTVLTDRYARAVAAEPVGQNCFTRRVASVEGRDDEAEANARLIATAPELLEAIKRADMWLGKMIADGGHLNAVMPNDCIRTAQMVRAAIAKATGP